MHAVAPDLADSNRRSIRWSAPAADPLFRREGDYWRIRWNGSVAFVANVCGMAYLAHLLARPGEAIHAMDLIHARTHGGGAVALRDHGLTMPADSDCGEHIDRRAREEYRIRSRELHRLLDLERYDRDHGLVAQWRTEVEFLDRELNRAVGVGGRQRRAGSFSERARINATRALREAVRRIDLADAALGNHLDRSLRTGVFCSYAPRPATITWSL